MRGRAVFTVAIGIALIVGVLHACGGRTVALSPSFQLLRGRWQRPDGGYIVAITQVSEGGELTASYFNPNPIRVEKAVAARDGSRLALTIILRDVNYPGSTYTLTYDPADDRLRGTYYQAVAQETYQVFFLRLAP